MKLFEKFSVVLVVTGLIFTGISTAPVFAFEGVAPGDTTGTPTTTPEEKQTAPAPAPAPVVNPNAPPAGALSTVSPSESKPDVSKGEAKGPGKPDAREGEGYFRMFNNDPPKKPTTIFIPVKPTEPGESKPGNSADAGKDKPLAPNPGDAKPMQ